MVASLRQTTVTFANRFLIYAHNCMLNDQADTNIRTQDIRAPSPNAIAERLTNIVRAMTTNPQAPVAQTAPVSERIDIHILYKRQNGAEA